MTQNEIDETARLWEKTKDPKYKEWFDGPYNLKRRSVQSHTSDKTDDGRYDVIRPAKFFRPLRHHKIKINNIR